jgi:hypothetical protein
MKEEYWLKKYYEQQPISVDAFLITNGIVDLEFRDRLLEMEEAQKISKEEIYD